MARYLMPSKKYAGHGSGKKGISPSTWASCGPRRGEGPGQLVDFLKFLAPGLSSLGNYRPVSTVAY